MIFIVLVLVALIVYMIGLKVYSFWKPEDLSVRSDVVSILFSLYIASEDV